MPTESGQGTAPHPPTHEELVGAFPNLEILELIGQGGMGFVYRARQPRIDRLVALKILPQSLAGDPAFAERFTREGSVLARLNHPNIVTLHDFGQARGFFYLLMEFVDGVNLRQAMRAGRFTPGQALAIVPKICEALEFAHNEGVLHRDIKPENILLDAKGRVKIADFGIAKLMGETHAEAMQTGTGATLGTPHYMAPEQLENPAEVDQRADIYSLGVVFYEMLTGELPLGRFQPPSHKVEVDVRLDEVVLHALEKEPARRYQEVRQVKTAIDTIAGGGEQVGPAARPPLLPSAGAPKGRADRLWRAFVVGLITVLAILVAAPILYWSLSRTRDPLSAPLQSTVPPPIQSGSGRLVIATVPIDVVNPEPGEHRWGFKAFIPPDHLASFLFVRWTNDLPAVDAGFSTYFKVGNAGGIDLPFCSLNCYRIPESSFAGLTDAELRQRLATWNFPESAGLSNAVRWDVNLGAGFTASRWLAMPSYHAREFTLPQSVRSGYQRVIRLVDFELADNGIQGQAGVELRILLEPLTFPPLRIVPNEIDRTNYVAGSGLSRTIDETLDAIKNLPVDP